MSSNIEVPEGLTDLLQNFTISVLRNKPINLIRYAFDYFKDLSSKNEDQMNNSGNLVSEESDNEDHIQRQVQRGRRQSVAAESCNPEKDDEDEELPVVYSKTDVQRSRLVEAIKPIFLFRSLDEEQRSKVIDSMREITVEPEEKVITQGDDGDDFYVIEKGIFDIYVNGSKIGNYNNCGSFGELALMYNTPRAATIIAKSKGILWIMDRKTFRHIVLKAAFKRRQMYEGLLESVSLLGELSPYDRTNVADALLSRTYEDGAMILEQGKPGMEMFFIETGEVRVMRDPMDGSAPKEVNRLFKGDYFGEVALLIKETRLASVYAVGKTTVAVLDIKSFERLLGPCINLMKKNLPKYQAQLRDILGSKMTELIPELSK